MTVTAGPIEKPPTNPFAWNLPSGKLMGWITRTRNLPKVQCSDLNPFRTVQLLDYPVLHVLMYHIVKLEDPTDTALTTFTAESKSEVGDLDSLLADLHNSTNKHFYTQKRELRSI